MKNKFLLFFFIILSLNIFLRFKNILISPPSPYWEEVAIAYDSHSIIETGMDHHGNSWPVTAFESFGDWKPSLYFYASIPFIKVFGLNTLAVRLVSMIAGVFLSIGTALFVYLLSAKIFKNIEDGEKLNLVFLIAFFLASISPWAITFSRAAWESNLATSLIIWGINFFLIFINKVAIKEKYSKKLIYLFLSVLSLSLSSYAYHSARFTAPILGLALVLIYFFLEKKKSDWKLLFPAFLLAFLLMMPIIKSLQSNIGQQRIAETSIFSDISIIEKSNNLKAAAGNTIISRIIYHRYLLFAKEISLNFADHFSYNYLFVTGDSNPRHSIQNFGLFYSFEIIFFLLGIIFIIKNWNKYFGFLLFYLLIAIFPAAVTKTTPHALRTLASLPVFITILSFGFLQLLFFIKTEKLKKLFIIIILACYSYQLSSFWNSFQNNYRLQYSNHWQYAYEELMIYLAQEKNNYEKIYISREEGRPAMYYWFYNQVDPRLVQEANSRVKKDQGEFLEFENIEFINGVGEFVEKEALLVSSEKLYKEELKNNKLEILKEIEDLSGKTVWMIYLRREE